MHDLAKSYDGRSVLRGVDLTVDPGHRAGLVGENGVGKSTLLRLVAGLEDADGGDVVRPPDLGYLHQELPYAATTTVGDLVEDALAHVRALEADLERAGAALTGDGPDGAGQDAADAFDLALARAEQADVWSADVRAARTLAGLGLDGVDRERPVARMSGGQRTRLGLAALLIRQPGALLLDEPTNHLDDDAAEFLATALRALPGAVLLASHDRVFLDEVCTEIVDLDPTQAATSAGRTGLTVYGGGYSDFLDAKRVERERWEQRFAAEQEELAGLRRSVATTARELGYGRRRDNDTMAYGVKGNDVQQQISRRVRNARLRLDTLEAEQVRKPPAPLRFAPPASRGATSRGASSTGGSVVAWARDVVVRADAGRAVRLDMRASGVASLDVAAGARLLVTGANGAGKSTLLHVLAGDLAPDEGVAATARGVHVGLLEQDPRLGDESRTPRTLLALVAGVDPLDVADARVDAHGLVAPRDLDRPVGALSVGQRRRVLLAMLVTQSPDVLLLDEPTNHISLALADELMAAIEGWPGAVVVASHDRWLRRRWTGSVVRLG
ncbi:macrolide transport system ATP-binding/permease protein [Sediminihabitans luteus]|uniref:Macrolide transport system ATP-binding/permease protein n=1 Tax=Sediminihabitans luteus TaxID=1138585 RepID=A0A2M9CEX6_9CELL|nr:macrolide transport system ATP-binding/permease protein [Sediminihabitans luteus]